MTNIKNTIAAATISIALAAGLAPVTAFAATDAAELPVAVTMAAQAATTQASINNNAGSAFADTLHTLIADEAAKVYTAHAQAQGLDADAAVVTVYNA